jgi:SAM-dependent methyltransferase
MSANAYCTRADTAAGLTPEFDEPLRQCPLCGSSAIRKYDHDYEGRRVDRCRACRLLFMNPQYTARYLDRYYAHYGQSGADVLRIPDPDDLSVRRTAAKADAIQRLERYTKPGRFLSIGCYDGVELLVAQRRGWQPEGYDVDATTMKLLREQVDFPIYTGDFFELGLPADHYDCVYMDQVLEHPKNPQDYLREAHRILAPGGLLYIGCPNIESISSRLKTLLGKLGLKRRRGKHYDMFHHLFFYDPRTLARIMESHYGYEIVVTEGDPVIGLKSIKVEETWRTRASNSVRRKYPILESSFRLVARKPVAAAHARRRAA